jgi:hypothetical protein
VRNDPQLASVPLLSWGLEVREVQPHSPLGPKGDNGEKWKEKREKKNMGRESKSKSMNKCCSTVPWLVGSHVGHTIWLRNAYTEIDVWGWTGKKKKKGSTTPTMPTKLVDENRGEAAGSGESPQGVQYGSESEGVRQAKCSDQPSKFHRRR